MDKFMDLIAPKFSLSALKEVIENRCCKYYDIICDPNTTINDPEVVQATRNLLDAIRLQNALTSIEDRYSDYMKNLIKEVKVIATQIDKL